MATAAAAVIAKARRDVLSHFMQANAVDAGSASRFVPERRVQQRVLGRMVRQGILVQVQENTYFLNLPAYDDRKRRVRRRIAILAASGAALAGLAGLLA